MPIDPVFALMWAVGAACAVGAAQQAKYHRLVALIMVGGAGLITALPGLFFAIMGLCAVPLARRLGLGPPAPPGRGASERQIRSQPRAVDAIR